MKVILYKSSSEKESKSENFNIHCFLLKHQIIKMHGRVKVKSTAQQQEEKRIEREGKLKSYRFANCYKSLDLYGWMDGWMDGWMLLLTLVFVSIFMCLHGH